MRRTLAVFILAIILYPCAGFAHFGIIIPSESMVMSRDQHELQLNIGFVHPFVQQSMDMQKPQKFFVLHNGVKTSLEDTLKPAIYWDKKSWECQYAVQKPGVYIFAAFPAPYYEAAEDRFIIHYVKTVIGAYGGEDGWDAHAKTPVEIIPLSRPFGNYAGNVFYGQALFDGKPLANTIVEVSNLNRTGAHKAPNAYFEIQTVKTDANGIFVFGIPWAGWWGFAALHESPDKIELDGKIKDVELGGVLWVYFSEPMLTPVKK